MDAMRIQQGLQGYYQRNWPALQTVEVDQIENITTGWECELFSFVVESGVLAARRREVRVLRLHKGVTASQTAQHEFTTIQRLGQVGYPAPQVFALEADPTLFGAPFLIMEKIEGEVMGAMMKRATPDQTRTMLFDFVRLLVQLHRLDWRHFVTAEAAALSYDPFSFIDQWLVNARRRCQRLPAIDFAPVVAWLERQRDGLACMQPAPIHRDFHPDNILVRPSGAPVVIDWTTFAVSDARFDLAWTLLLFDMHINTAVRQQVHQAYDAIHGQPVAQMECFLVTACFRRLMDFALSVTAGAEQAGMRAEAVTAMKAHHAAFVRAYDLLVSLTEIRLPQLETFLADLA